MFRILLVSGLATLALSQCPSDLSQSDSCSSYDSSEEYGGGTCKAVTTIDRSLSAIAAQQPERYTFLPNIPEYNQLDNVCITLFSLFNDTETYVIYEARVFCDGSLLIVSYIGKNNGTGINVWANADNTVTNYVLGYAECGTYVKYRCGDCGDVTDETFLFGMSPTLDTSEGAQAQMLSVACQQEAFDIARAQGLIANKLYVLPNKLPFQCVYQQRGQPRASPANCQQQGACQPY